MFQAQEVTLVAQRYSRGGIKAVLGDQTSRGPATQLGHLEGARLSANPGT